MLNGNQTLSGDQIEEIETIIDDLEAKGKTAFAIDLKKKLSSKLNPPIPEKKKWKFW